MYGQTVYVKFKGKTREVFVCCNPKTPLEKLEQWAIERLEKLAEKYGSDFEWAYEGMRKGYNV